MVAQEVILLPETTYELRKFLYKDVEELIFPGFLSHKVKLGSSRVVMRSLHPGDTHMLELRAAGQRMREWKLWSVAMSIWMIDGRNLLTVDDAAPWVYDQIKLLPEVILDRLFSVVLALFKRVNKAMDAVEAFTYEDRSMAIWQNLHGDHPRNHVGIAGVDKMSTNPVQRIWMYVCQIEDYVREEKREWERTWAIVGVWASKGGMNKIRSSQAEADQDRERIKQETRDLFYYRSIGLLPEEETESKGEESSTPAIRGRKKSLAELQDEYKRWVTGDQDFHDQIVEDYKQRILDAKKQREEDLRRQREEFERRYEEEYGDEPDATSLVAYTPEQLQEVLSKRDRKQGVGWVPSSAYVKQHTFTDKYLKEADPGLVEVDDQGRVRAPGSFEVEGDDLKYRPTPAPTKRQYPPLSREALERRRLRYSTKKSED